MGVNQLPQQGLLGRPHLLVGSLPWGQIVRVNPPSGVSVVPVT